MSTYVKQGIINNYLNQYRKFLLYVAPLTTLIISPFWNFDPISCIKMIPITSIAFGLATLVLINRKKFLLSFKENKFLIYLTMGFIVSLFVPLLFSDSPLNQQFWGTFGRNTGFLSYFSLSILLLITGLLATRDFFDRFNNSLYMTGWTLTGYGIVQYLKKDPIGWSEKQTFGTLGNVNFMSALLGMVVCISLANVLDSSKKRFFRLTALLLIVIDVFLIISTGSIQGLMVVAVGTSVLAFHTSGYLFHSKLPILLSFIIVFAGGVLGIGGIFNKGPLAKFIFQPSIIFRSDYVHAGYAMTIEKPLFGVGLDSYGDWYRQSRGEISTLRTGPDRISNTAHNIFLDISSGGGILLFTFYLLLNLYALVLGTRYLASLIRHRKADSIFAAGFACWVGYVVQALISINQLGVGVWGWIFTGLLIGYVNKFKVSTLELKDETSLLDIRKDSSSKRQKDKRRTLDALSPRDFLLMFIGSVVGFLVAVIPARADATYKTATQKGTLEGIIASTRVLGSTEWHSEMVLDKAMQIQAYPQAAEIATYLIKEYPRSYFAWRALYVLPNTSPQMRGEAAKKLKVLDPFNPYNAQLP